MRALSIFALVIAVLGLIFVLIATFTSWIQFLGGVPGALVSIFLLPFAVIAMPVISGLLDKSILSTIIGYLNLGVVAGFFMLAQWAGDKADEKQREREAFQIWLQNYGQRAEDLRKSKQNMDV